MKKYISILLSITKDNTITDTSKSKNVVNNSNNGTNSFEKYFRLIGMSKEKLISTLNEQPVSVDESGLEFKKMVLGFGLTITMV